MVENVHMDTNVLLHNPGPSLPSEDNEVVIPMAVIEEIENQKKRQDEIGRNARVVSQELDKMRRIGLPVFGVPLPRAADWRIEPTIQDAVGNSRPASTRERGPNRILPWPTA